MHLAGAFATLDPACGKLTSGLRGNGARLDTGPRAVVLLPPRRTGARLARSPDALDVTPHGGPIHAHRLARRLAPLAASVAVLGLALTFALAPQPAAITAPSAASDTLRGATQANLRRRRRHRGADGVARVVRPTTGSETLVGGRHQRRDWAKLVLVEGDWPVTEENVTFMMRWMRQENGADNWWNRNNPLNNGQGSGGGSGLGSYPTLVEAAFYAAQNLQSGRYPDGRRRRSPEATRADATAQAIWASAWASSHYGYGTHWSSRPYEVIEAPPSAWGR